METVAWVRYQWDCPACGSVNECEDDPQGEVVNCEDCDSNIRIVETR